MMFHTTAESGSFLVSEGWIWDGAYSLQWLCSGQWRNRSGLVCVDCISPAYITLEGKHCLLYCS